MEVFLKNNKIKATNVKTKKESIGIKLKIGCEYTTKFTANRLVSIPVKQTIKLKHALNLSSFNFNILLYILSFRDF